MLWIIDTSKDDESNEKLIKGLDNLKVNYVLYKYKPFMSYIDITEDLQKYKYFDEKIICYGTINFISKIQRGGLFKSFCNFDRLRCSSYYPHLKGFLLNENYKIIEWKDIEKYLTQNLVFIRPDSGKKIFTGTITNIDYLSSDVGFQVINLQPETKIVISPYKEIEKEWRFFASKNNVITGSLYHLNDEHIEEESYDQEAYKLALKVSNLYLPDPIFVVDICKTKSGVYKVLELNGFSCSGLYKCNIEKIIKFVNEEIKSE